MRQKTSWWSDKILCVGIMVAFYLSLTGLAGCSSTISTVSANNSLTTVSKLALGTLELEGTANAVTSDQARELLPLWQAYQSLSNSDTASQVELDALVKQIDASMTAEQLEAIDMMSLTEQALAETLSTLGGNTSSTAHSGTTSASASGLSSSSNGSAVMPSSGPGGVPPNDLGGMPSGGDNSGLGSILNGVSEQTSASATQSTTGSQAVQINPILLQAVIQLLETSSQSAG
jgi:hypothetical protein